MSLSVCPDCGKPIESPSGPCPDCAIVIDHPETRGQSRTLATVVFVLLIIGIAITVAAVAVMMIR